MYDVLGAVLDLEVAVRLHYREVAERNQPPQRPPRRLAVLQVALHGDVPAEHDLAQGLASAGTGFRVCGSITVRPSSMR